MATLPYLEESTSSLDLTAMSAVISRYWNDDLLPSKQISKLLELLLRFKCKKIAIEGPIAAGKTYLGKSLAKYARDHGILAEFYPEEVDLTLLTRFYESVEKNEKPSAAAYELQLDTLRRAESAYRAADELTARGGIAILDRSRWGQATFIAMHIGAHRFTTEQQTDIHNALKKSSNYTVDHVVYLDVHPVVAYDRATNLRARPEERKLSREYMYDFERANLLQIYHQLATRRANNLTIIRNDVFRTPEEVFQILDSAPSSPFPVTDFDIQAAMRDPAKVRSFFVHAGEYYCRGH